MFAFACFINILYFVIFILGIFSVEGLDNSGESEKKTTFERFLTYRRRMARLCAVQGMYLYDIDQSIIGSTDSNAKKGTSETTEVMVKDITNSILYFYRNIFFSDDDYHATKKNKRIDERYFAEIIEKVIVNMSKIDSFISESLNERWTIDKLDLVVKAILRCAVSEILYNIKTDIPILTSEYTNLASNFFSGKQIGFVNGIVDRVAKMKRNSEK